MKARLVGLTVLAVLLMIPSASAMAHEFSATATTAIVGSGGKQSFNFNTGSFTCENAALEGSTKAGTGIESLVAYLTFTGCAFFGDSLRVSAPFTLLLMPDGSVALLNNVVLTIPVAKCSLLIFGGPVSAVGKPNASLKTVKFNNAGKNIEFVGNISGITYESSGGICGTAKVSAKNGTYTGIDTFEPASGTLKWS
jgi:hypothetical protein